MFYFHTEYMQNTEYFKPFSDPYLIKTRSMQSDETTEYLRMRSIERVLRSKRLG